MPRPSGARRAAFVVVTVLLPPLLAAAGAGAIGPGIVPLAPVTSTWASAAAPVARPARVIGGYGAACIEGAVPLPADGPGYQAVDLARNRHYGHPLLVSFVTDVGRSVERERLGTLLVGDMAQPRGGPMPSGHVSHQGGLDVDLWYRLDVPPRPPQAREGIPEPSLVVGGRPDPARWTDRQVELVRLAALDPRVARVFVGAALKRDLCQREAASPDRGWLRVVRPWPGHDDHLHVRLRCPAGSPACIGQPSLPPGDGCSPVELDAAVARERAQSRRPPPVPRQILPPACRSVLAAAL